MLILLAVQTADTSHSVTKPVRAPLQPQLAEPPTRGIPGCPMLFSSRYQVIVTELSGGLGPTSNSYIYIYSGA